MSARRRPYIESPWARRGRSALVWLLAAVVLLPFVQMVYVARKPRHLVDDAYYYLSRPGRLPEHEVRRKVEVGTRPLRAAVTNSIVVSGACAVLCVPICLMAGYAFARRRFRGKETLFGLVLLSMSVPPVILMMPLFRLSVALHLYDTLLMLILPFCATGFGIFYMRCAISTVSRDVVEAARLDGLSELGVLFRIITPAIRPSVVTLAVLQFLASWSAFVLPQALVRSEENYTVAILLGRLLSDFRNLMWNDIMLVVATGVLPILLVFALFSRRVLQGLTTPWERRPGPGGPP